MQNHQTILHCQKSTAIFIITTTTLLFLLIGCASLFRSAGLTDDQAAEQTAQLKTALSDAATAAVADITTGLAEGHDLKTIAARASSAFLWKIIAAAGASAGIVLNGLLAKWLGTEKKINKAIITGVENSNDKSTKTAIRTAAIAAGIEPKLHARVQTLT